MNTNTENLNSNESQRAMDSCMRRALALARRGSGLVKPNPMVGAVIVNDGRVVGAGWHQRAGAPHAEIEALKVAGEKARGGTLYVTLEPCNHFGRTPPCTDAIIQSGLSRVVVAMADPNPNVKGGGVSRLREAGIDVSCGVLAKQARELNQTWAHWVRTRMPFVTLKIASSLDGRIARPERQQRWLSSQISRAQVHRLRRHFDAIMVGAGTVLQDNPFLTNRSGAGCQPLRVIIDPLLEIEPGANVFRTRGLDQDGPTPSALVITTSQGSYQSRRRLELSGVQVEVIEGADGRVDLESTFRMLGARGIQGVLCEGGTKIASSLVREGLCHRILLYQAPTVIGARGQPLFVDEVAVSEELERSYLLDHVRKVGPDALLVFDALNTQDLVVPDSLEQSAALETNVMV